MEASLIFFEHLWVSHLVLFIFELVRSAGSYDQTETTFPVCVSVEQVTPSALSAALRAPNLHSHFFTLVRTIVYRRIITLNCGGGVVVLKCGTSPPAGFTGFSPISVGEKKKSNEEREREREREGEMSSWGLEILKTAGPVFVMIDQRFDNGAKGKKKKVWQLFNVVFDVRPAFSSTFFLPALFSGESCWGVAAAPRTRFSVQLTHFSKRSASISATTCSLICSSRFFCWITTRVCTGPRKLVFSAIHGKCVSLRKCLVTFYYLSSAGHVYRPGRSGKCSPPRLVWRFVHSSQWWTLSVH